MDIEKISLTKKIDFLNKACNESLSLLASPAGWSLHSYLKGTPFHVDNGPWLYAESLEELIDLAIKRLVVDLTFMKIIDKDENSK